MFDRASLKLGLDKAVLQSMSGRDSAVSGVCTLCLTLTVLCTVSAQSHLHHGDMLSWYF